jgi:hypothetical protein
MEAYANEHAKQSKQAFKADYLLAAADLIMLQAGVESDELTKQISSTHGSGFWEFKTFSVTRSRSSNLIPTGEVEPWGGAGRHRYLKIYEVFTNVFEVGHFSKLRGARALTPLPKLDSRLVCLTEYAGVNPGTAGLRLGIDEEPMVVKTTQPGRFRGEGSIDAMDRFALRLGEAVAFNGFSLPRPSLTKSDS